MIKSILNQLKRLLLLREISSFIMFFAVVIVFFSLSPLFLSRQNIIVVADIVPELGIVALGVTMLMISGEFDLSVGSVFAFTPIMMVMMITAGMHPVLAIIVALFMAIGIGALNGVITLSFGIPSFITTLGGMLIWRGAILLITGGWPPFFPAEFPAALFVGRIGMFRASLLWYFAITVLLWIILERTDFGNWMFATGGNRIAARAMGIETGRVKLLNFMLCSFLAGFTGIVQSSRLTSTIPTMGSGIEMEAIASTVIGGTALMGGVGTVIGTVVGSFLIRVIDNGLVLARVPGYWFRVFIGIATISAVIFNIYISGKAKKLRC